MGGGGEPPQLAITKSCLTDRCILAELSSFCNPHLIASARLRLRIIQDTDQTAERQGEEGRQTEREERREGEKERDGGGEGGKEGDRQTQTDRQTDR